MPEVVEGELEAQFIRSVNAAHDAAEQTSRRSINFAAMS
jgi:hypothetical protein